MSEQGDHLSSCIAPSRSPSGRGRFRPTNVRRLEQAFLLLSRRAAELDAVNRCPLPFLDWRPSVTAFAEEMKASQVRWRRNHLSNQVRGRQNKREYDHILPLSDWELNLWPGIATGTTSSLPKYLYDNRIRKHTGAHNLLSSWTLCANLYFPFRDPAGRSLLAGFLRESVSSDIDVVTAIELEYESPNPRLKPAVLLGETDGGRGAGQTSPDMAFEVQTSRGAGVILVESKFTEHHFYRCSGRKKKPVGRIPNPDTSRCLNPLVVLSAPQTQCHLNSWDRLYWSHLAPVANRDALASLKCCPAAFDGYQLFRQQALAEALAQSGAFATVLSCVAYDSRNGVLMHCLRQSTGLEDIERGWQHLFPGKSRFATFTHQQWVRWVASHASDARADWLDYVRDRYGIG